MEAFALSPDAPRVPLPQRLLSDERLLRLIAAGNAQAFGAVYARYHAPLYAYCRSIVRDPDDARDALQTTMVKALASLAGGGEDRDVCLKPWLFRIAHNESISLLRRRRPSEPLTDAVSPPVAGAHAQAEARERLAQLVSDLQELPERQRGALIMREVNGLSYGEIAAALEVSEGTARQTVFEARTALAEYGEGREVACENIRRSISDGDGRALRARRVRAHLRACDRCRAFQTTLQTRRRDLAMLTPALSAGSVVALMQGALSAGVATTAAGAGAAAATGGAGLLGTSASGLLASGAAKSVVAIVAATAAGAGAIEIEHGGSGLRAKFGAAAMTSSSSDAAPGPAQAEAAAMIRTAGTRPDRALTPLSRSLVRTAPAAAQDGRVLPDVGRAVRDVVGRGVPGGRGGQHARPVVDRGAGRPVGGRGDGGGRADAGRDHGDPYASSPVGGDGPARHEGGPRAPAPTGHRADGYRGPYDGAAPPQPAAPDPPAGSSGPYGGSSGPYGGASGPYAGPSGPYNGGDTSDPNAAPGGPVPQPMPSDPPPDGGGYVPPGDGGPVPPGP